MGCTKLLSDLTMSLLLDALTNDNHSESVVHTVYMPTAWEPARATDINHIWTVLFTWHQHMNWSGFTIATFLVREYSYFFSSYRNMSTFAIYSNRFVCTLQRQSAIDEAEVSAATEDCDKFFQQAIVNFIKCLYFGDHHDLHIFTFVSLWFDNAQSPNVTKLLRVSSKQFPLFVLLNKF